MEHYIGKGKQWKGRRGLRGGTVAKVGVTGRLITTCKANWAQQRVSPQPARDDHSPTHHMTTTPPAPLVHVVAGGGAGGGELLREEVMGL